MPAHATIGPLSPRPCVPPAVRSPRTPPPLFLHPRGTARAGPPSPPFCRAAPPLKATSHRHRPLFLALHSFHPKAPATPQRPLTVYPPPTARIHCRAHRFLDRNAAAPPSLVSTTPSPFIFKLMAESHSPPPLQAVGHRHPHRHSPPSSEPLPR
jgi:hypothetical protein